MAKTVKPAIKLNTLDIEFAVANYMNPRFNLIVPNVYWGLGLKYEADLIIVSPSYYCTEIEIKITGSDILADRRKSYKAHNSVKIRRFFYAVPDYLQDCKYLPSDAGLITVDQNMTCKTIRPPRTNKNSRKLTEKEYTHLLHLGCMRIWGLKEALAKIWREKQNDK